MKIETVSIETYPKAGSITQGKTVTLKPVLTAKRNYPAGSDQTGQYTHVLTSDQLKNYQYEWIVTENGKETPLSTSATGQAQWTPTGTGNYSLRLVVKEKNREASSAGSTDLEIDVRSASSDEPTIVTLAPTPSADTNFDAYYQSIRESSRALDFSTYQKFVDYVMCKGPDAITDPTQKNAFSSINSRRASVFPGVDAYQRLKVATEVYLMLSVRVLRDYTFSGFDPEAHANKHGQNLTVADLQAQWDVFLKSENGSPSTLLPIDDLIRLKLKESIIPARNGDVTACIGLLQEKLRKPCFFELIWSYWHEEGMLVQTMKAIALRFQNQRASDRDPLASLDVSPLHPLSNLLWGYIQDEQHRLTIPRRAYEYDHHYGLALDGKAVPALRSADSRSKFVEAFHNLLHGAQLFFKQDDDTTKRADAFPVLNGLKEVHLLLREGMHNQFGDLPSTARSEMLIEQWILARPEMRDFLGGRPMMPYSEDWMERVDTMKKLKGWTDVSVTYFNELAEFGEQLLISIRHGDWSNIHEAAFAAQWAREWRSEVQQYVHAYRTVTGVDLAPDQTSVRLSADRYIQPSVLLRKRLDAQRQQPPDPAGFGSPRRMEPTTNATGALSRNGAPDNPPTDSAARKSTREAVEFTGEV